METRTEEEITIYGNPRKPVGEDGEKMLRRMNQSHYGVTGWALQFWKIAPSDWILDIGCGGGATLKRMAEQVETGHLVGVDYSATSVETSKKTNAAEISVGKMEIQEASVEALPFADNQFDKVITVESFYFWPNPLENLKEVLRVLKPQGEFLLVADVYDNGKLSEKVLENVERYQLFNPTKEKFGELFEMAGFSEWDIHVREFESWICVRGKK